MKNGTVNIEELQFLEPATQSVIKRYTVSSGDVYITIVGACIGDVGIIPWELNGANLTENAAKISDFKKCNNEYISLWLSSYYGQKFIKSKISSAAQGKLAISRIKTIYVPIPPLEEQQIIVSKVNNILKREIEIEKQITLSQKYYDKIQESLLFKAFRGQLGTNDPSEESAIELLKEVLQLN